MTSIAHGVKLGYTQSLTRVPEQRVQRHQFDNNYSAIDPYLAGEIADAVAHAPSSSKKLKKSYELNPPILDYADNPIKAND